MTIGLVPEGPRLLVVGVEVHNQKFEEWTDYDVDTDVFSPSDGFSMRTGPLDSNLIKRVLPGHRIRIYIGDGSPDSEVVIKNGWVEAFNSRIDKQTSMTDIAGRDLAADLIENSLPQGFSVKDKSFIEIVEEVVAPYGIPVYVTNEAARLQVADRGKSKKVLSKYNNNLATYNDKIKAIQKSLADQNRTFTQAELDKIYAFNGVVKPLRPPIVTGIFKSIKQAEPQDGESCWDFLVRYARRLEIHMWLSAAGALILQRPRYDQDPSYIFVNSTTDPTRNNVIRRSYRLDVAGMPTRLERTGRFKGEGEKREQIQSETESVKLLPESQALLIPQDSIVVADDFIRRKWITDTDARNQSELDRRNYYEMKAAETEFLSIQLDVQGHDQGGRLYVPDTVARVIDDDLELDGLFYVSACRYTMDQKTADMDWQRTSINLKPLYSWIPESE